MTPPMPKDMIITNHLGERRHQALSHLSRHLFDCKDRERLWRLMRDENYRRDQVRFLGRYHDSFEAIRSAIELYAETDTHNATRDDPRLSWLTLRAERLARTANSNVEEALNLARNTSRVTEALGRLETLSEKELFKATLILLLIEIEKGATNTNDAESNIHQILETVKHRIPGGSINWNDFLSGKLMVELCEKLLLLSPHVDLDTIIKHTPSPTNLSENTSPASASHEFLKSLRRQAISIADEKAREEALLATAKLFAKANLIEEALEISHQIDSATKRFEADALIVRFAAKRGSKRRAYSIANESVSSRSEILSSLAEELIRQADFEAALKITDEIDDVRTRATVLAHTAKKLFDAKLSDRSTAVFKRSLEAAESATNALPFIVRTLEKTLPDNRVLCASLLQRALALADRINLTDKSCQLKSDIVRVLALANDFEAATIAAEEIHRKFGRWRARAFSSIAENLARSRDKRAQDLFQHALREVENATIRLRWRPALTDIACAMARAGENLDAATVFQRAIRAPSKPRADWEDADNLIALFRGLASARDLDSWPLLFEDAVRATSRMNSSWWQAKALPHAATALGRVSPVNFSDLLRHLLAVIQDLNDSADRKNCLAEIARSFVGIQRYKDAICVARISADPHLLPEVLADFGHVLAKCGKLKEAEETLLEALRIGFSNPTSSKAQALLRPIRSMISLGLTKQALHTCRHVEPKNLRSLLMSEIAAYRMELGDVRAAREILEGTLSQSESIRRIQLDALAELIQHCDRSNDATWLRDIFQYSVSHFGSLKTAEEISDLALRLAREAARLRSRRERNRVLKDIFTVAQVVSPPWKRSALLLDLAKISIEAGEVDLAVAEDLLNSAGVSAADILSEAGLALGLSGRGSRSSRMFEKSLDLLSKIEISDSGTAPQVALLKKVLALKDIECRRRIYTRAIADIQGVARDTVRAKAALEIGKVVARDRDIVDLLDLIESTASIIVEAEMRLYTDELWAEAIRGLARAGSYAHALELTCRIPTLSWEHPKSICYIIQEHVAQSDFSEALDALSRVKPEASRAEGAARILEGIEAVPLDKSRSILDQLVKLTGEFREPMSQSAALVSLARATRQIEGVAVARGRFVKRINIMHSRINGIENEFDRRNVSLAVLKGWGELGELERSFDLFRRLASDRTFALPIEPLGDLIKWADDLSEGETWLERLRAYAETIDPPEVRAEALVALIVARCQADPTGYSESMFRGAISAIRKIESDISRRMLMSKTVRTISSCPPFPGRRRVCDRLLALVALVGPEEDQSRAACEIAEFLPKVDVYEHCHHALDAEAVSSETRRAFVAAWQSALLRDAKIATPALRYTLTCYPFMPEIGFLGVQCLAASHLKEGNQDAFREIIRECPELAWMAGGEAD